MNVMKSNNENNDAIRSSEKDFILKVRESVAGALQKLRGQKSEKGFTLLHFSALNSEETILRCLSRPGGPLRSDSDHG